MPARVVNGIPGRLAFRGREELCVSVLFLTKLDKLNPCCCTVITISSHHQQVLGAGEVIRHQHLRHQTASLNHCHHIYSALSSPSKTPAASAQLTLRDATLLPPPNGLRSSLPSLDVRLWLVSSLSVSNSQPVACSV